MHLLHSIYFVLFFSLYKLWHCVGCYSVVAGLIHDPRQVPNSVFLSTNAKNYVVICCDSSLTSDAIAGILRSLSIIANWSHRLSTE